MAASTRRLRFVSRLTFLVICMFILAGRIMYMVLSDATYFPINTVKVSASYEHLTRQQLESILASHLRDSFFSISVAGLRQDLLALDWSQEAIIEREWPDTLSIRLVEKKPIAVWNGAFITADGVVFNQGVSQEDDEGLPHLTGPTSQQKDVLQSYEKLSKLLSTYGLSAHALKLRKNQAWELSLASGIVLRLGKQDLESRLRRFCRAYPAVFADKSEQLSSVDLRYARGMAVQWKQQTGR